MITLCLCDGREKFIFALLFSYSAVQCCLTIPLVLKADDSIERAVWDMSSADVANLWATHSYSLKQCVNIEIRPCSHMGNWKQWKWKPETENGNGKRKQSKLDANEC